MIKRIVLIIFSFMLIFFAGGAALLAISNKDSYKVESTYEKQNYEDVVVNGTFLIEGKPAQPATYEEDKIVTLNSTNGDGDDGQDHFLPDNATNVVISDDVCWESFNASGEPEHINGDDCVPILGFEGMDSLALQGITFGYDEPIAGDGVRIFSGEISYSVPGALLTPATPSTMDETVNTMIIQEYDDKTGEKADTTCFQKGSEVDCSKVEWYAELYSTIDEQAKLTQTSEVVTETLKYSTRSDTWTATSGNKTIAPEELVNYDSMKKEIDSEINSNG